MNKFILGACFVLGAALASAGTVTFPQCPKTGANTGCEFLITISNSGVTIAQDTAAGGNTGPYDSSEDVLIGIVNTSSVTQTSVFLSSPSVNIFGFDGDGPCTQNPGPNNCNTAATAFGYGGPGVTFSGISANAQSGAVNFSLAPGATAWFALEGAPTLQQIVVGTPEPATLALIGSGLALIGLARRKK